MVRSLTTNAEVHMVAASDAQLTDPQLTGRTLPTYGYYHAGREMVGSSLSPRIGPLITGSHSTVDLHFEDAIATMAGILQEMHPDETINLPPPCNLARRQ